MKPVLVLQHLDDDGPAYLRTWLERQGQPLHVVNSAAGDAVPADIGGYRALAVLGGAMSANDALPSLRRAERLIAQAVDRGVPVAGHCLGGQLMARALGAEVRASPLPEVGWQPVTRTDAPAARAWFGDDPTLTVFHWHGESFALPPGATLLARNDACPNQAFALGPHLAMQFHVELDAAKLRIWVDADDALLAATPESATVHSRRRMLDETAVHLTAQQRLADRVYDRWLTSAAT